MKQQGFSGNSNRGEKKVEKPIKMDKAWAATQKMNKRLAAVEAAKKKSD